MTDSLTRRLWSHVARILLPGRQSAPDTSLPTTMYQPENVRLFIKPYCGWCSQAMDWLDRQGIRYETLDVIADENAYREMYRLSGQTLAPVIEADGMVLADFGARDLPAFWTRLGNGASKS